jgi:GNAT superfamily N-acetyltransferase
VTPPRAAPPEPGRARGPGAAVLRPATTSDRGAIEALVERVAVEVYGHLFPDAPPRPDGRWAQGVVAEAAGRVVAVMVSDDDWIEDLWVAADWRRRGIGSRLLRAGERQIAARGCKLARLRVIAENHGARCFYARHGWSEAEIYPHERWGFEMVDMVKRVTYFAPDSEA